ncbi:MAG TPA: NAD(+) diphosphatase [Thermomicrobiales bacterium]|nr:NAD(+) diphosphatase [Thermomicrobiales bacterium]
MKDSPPDQFLPETEPGDRAWDAASGGPRGRCFAFSGSDMVILGVASESPQIPSWDDLRAWEIAAVRYQYLGTLGGEPCWSAELAPKVRLPEMAMLSGLRALYDGLPEIHYAVAGRAAQIVAWDRDHQHCGRCGEPTERVPGERGRRCARCDLTAYPRVSPAIIVLIERGDRILLARGRAFVPRRFGIIAGFVEPGESLEDAVRREVREEVGLELTDIDYFGSQPWPFPHGIMIGFRARYLRGKIRLGDGELVEARWYGREDLPEIPAKLSIARRLIDDWAERQGFAIAQP